MSSKIIIIRYQQAIEQEKVQGIILKGVNKSMNNDIRIQCDSEEHAKQLKKIRWDRMFMGLKVHKATYGLVIHGVSKDEINLVDSASETSAIIEIQQ